MIIDTRKSEHRTLRFQSIDDLSREFDVIVEAERNGTLRTTGNWTAGQALGHLAAWIDYGWDGFPPEATPPWIIGFILRKFMKKRLLRDGMTPGVKIPRITEGTLATEIMSTDEGARRLRRSLERLKAGEPVRHHSPAFGPMSDDERIALHLRHAELHLGFLHPA